MELLYPLATLTFAHSWVFIIPVLIIFFLISSKKPAAVSVGAISAFADLPSSLRLKLRRPVLNLLAALSLCLLTIAAARPQKITIVSSPKEARNLMLSLDTSRSMGTEDFDSPNGRLSRIDAVRYVVSEFIEQRVDDRIGLVVFGSSAYLQAPLTLDHAVVGELTRQIELGMAGDGTALGDGLGLAIKRLTELPGKTKAIVLLTDGVSNAGQVNPLKAAEVAKDLGIKVHTIGIGSARTHAEMRGGIFTQHLVKQAEYDEKTLRKIAEITGGEFFNASSIEGLKNVYNSIDLLEKSDTPQPEQRLIEEYFPKFALYGMLFGLTFIFMARTIFLKVP